MEKYEIPEIPFGGGKYVGDGVSPSMVDNWVRERDKVPLLLALSLYGKPRASLDNYILIPGSYTVRSAIWFDQKTGIAIVGCRGTSPFGQFGRNDLKDDHIIAVGQDYCDLSLVREVSENMSLLEQQTTLVIFVGHSLGGTTAFCLTLKYTDSIGIGLNAGAAPTNPILAGPGKRFTHYHVFGDLISTHMSPLAADIVRVRKNGVGFGDMAAHSSDTILIGKPWKLCTANEEDKAYYKWGTTFTGSYINHASYVFAKYLAYLKIKHIVEKSPIPGSSRFNNV